MQFFIFILLLTVPLPLASARPVWEWLWACLIGLSVLLWSWHLVRTRDWPPGAVIVWPVLGLGAVAVWGLAQAEWGLSPDPGATMAVAVYFLAHLLWFLIVVAAFSSRQAVCKLVRWLAVVGTLYAAYGLLVYFSGNKSLLWYEKWAYPHSLTSTFVNRNSYAAYCGLALQCLLADLLFRYGSSLASFGPRNFSWHDFIARHMVSGLWQFASGVILLTALLLTGSRAGIVTTLVASSVLVLTAAALGIRGDRLVRLPVAATGLLLVLATVFGMSGSMFETRLGIDSARDQRFEVYPLIVRAIEEHPLVGHGIGNFEEVFRSYRAEDVSVGFDRAHNDYLEIAMTAGLPVAFVFFLAIVAIVSMLIRSIDVSQPYWHYVVLGITASLQLGLHSAIDFSLQMPAISYSYLAILVGSLVVAASTQRRSRKGMA